MSEIFKVERVGHATKITNFSDRYLLVYVTPIPPKRKHKLSSIIQPRQFIIWEAIPGFQFDLTRINFRLEKVNTEINE